MRALEWPVGKVACLAVLDGAGPLAMSPAVGLPNSKEPGIQRPKFFHPSALLIFIDKLSKDGSTVDRDHKLELIWYLGWEVINGDEPANLQTGSREVRAPPAPEVAPRLFKGDRLAASTTTPGSSPSRRAPAELGDPQRLLA